MPQESQRTTTSTTTRPPAPSHVSAEEKSKHDGQGMREQAGRAADAAREELGVAAERVRGATTDAAHRARESAESFAARQKETAAAEISHVGEAMQRAAEKLHEDNDHRLASYAEAAASRVRSVADYLKQHEVSDLFADMQTMARRHPAAVCGGMFAVGVAMARFLKASPPPQQTSPSGPRTETWQETQSPMIRTTTGTTATKTTTF